MSIFNALEQIKICCSILYYTGVSVYGDKRMNSEADDDVLSLLERIIQEKTRDVSEADSEADQQDVADKVNNWENNNEDDFKWVFSPYKICYLVMASWIERVSGPYIARVVYMSHICFFMCGSYTDPCLGQ